MTSGDEMTSFNGQDMPIRDVPDRFIRAMLGYGHEQLMADTVWGNGWPYTPETCEWADESDKTEWVAEGTVLVCTGCGLDCT